MTLADVSNTDPSAAHFPPGHPFAAPNAIYWSIDRIPASLADGAIVVFFDANDGGAGINHINSFQFPGARAWCVRGMGGAPTR
jgi:hypothetical protein